MLELTQYNLVDLMDLKAKVFASNHAKLYVCLRVLGSNIFIVFLIYTSYPPKKMTKTCFSLISVLFHNISKS